MQVLQKAAALLKLLPQQQNTLPATDSQLPITISQTPVKSRETPLAILNPAAPYDWSTPTAVRHSIRVICDEEKLDWDQKEIQTACIYQESRFNPRAIGEPNRNGTRDWGLCQYNDGLYEGKPIWIGHGAPFKDTQEVLDNPEKNVRVMARYYKTHGNLAPWSSYSFPKGHPAYLQWLHKV